MLALFFLGNGKKMLPDLTPTGNVPPGLKASGLNAPDNTPPEADKTPPYLIAAKHNGEAHGLFNERQNCSKPSTVR